MGTVRTTDEEPDDPFAAVGPHSAAAAVPDLVPAEPFPDGPSATVSVPEPFPAEALIAFLRDRYAEQRSAALEQRMQFWQEEVADANTKQSIVDAGEQSARQATEYGRLLAQRVSAGIPAAQPELVETARWEGHAAALLHVLCLLARPYAGHPEYRPEWRP